MPGSSAGRIVRKQTGAGGIEFDPQPFQTHSAGAYSLGRSNREHVAGVYTVGRSVRSHVAGVYTIIAAAEPLPPIYGVDQQTFVSARILREGVGGPEYNVFATEFEIATDEDFNDVVFSSGVLAVFTQHQLGDILSPATKYYLRGRDTNFGGTSEWSDTVEFLTLYDIERIDDLTVEQKFSPLRVGLNWTPKEGATAHRVKRKKKGAGEPAPPPDPEDPPEPDPENMPPSAPASVQAHSIDFNKIPPTVQIEGGPFFDPDGGTHIWSRAQVLNSVGQIVGNSGPVAAPAGTPGNPIEVEIPGGLDGLVPRLQYSDELDWGDWGYGAAFSSIEPPAPPEEPPPPVENEPPKIPTSVTVFDLDIEANPPTLKIEGSAYDDPDGGAHTKSRARVVNSQGIVRADSGEVDAPAGTPGNPISLTFLDNTREAGLIPQLAYKDEKDFGGFGSGSPFSTIITVPPAPDFVDIPAGGNLAAFAAQYPAGTKFRLLGTGIENAYRITETLDNELKNGQEFHAVEPGNVFISGARLLTNWEQVSGGQWRSAGNVQIAGPRGSCQDDHPLCNRPEILWRDDLPMEPVGSRSALGPGKFFFEYSTGFIYVSDDPRGHRMEIPRLEKAFTGSRREIALIGLVIEKFGSRAQDAAISLFSAPDWVIHDCFVQFNSAGGLRVGPRLEVRNSRFLRNGQLGFQGEAPNVSIIGGECAYNNFAGYQRGWEAGGSKFVRCVDLLVEGVWVHHNLGFGLWSDIDNLRVTYRNNIVEDNYGAGIFHEISSDALIEGNKLRRNGFISSHPNNPYAGATQILVSASRNVEVRNNDVRDGPSGISAIQQARNFSNVFGYEHRVINLWVHHNFVQWNEGWTGVARDDGRNEIFSAGANNKFDFNNYQTSSTAGRFAWNGSLRNWAYWRNAGQDPNGTITAP